MGPASVKFWEIIAYELYATLDNRAIDGAMTSKHRDNEIQAMSDAGDDHGARIFILLTIPDLGKCPLFNTRSDENLRP